MLWRTTCNYEFSNPILALSRTCSKIVLKLSTLPILSVFHSYDYIEVYDGNEELSDKLGKFCGTTKPSPFVSSGNELLLKFHSDDTVNWKGFHAVYKLVDPLSEESVAPSQAPVSHLSVDKPKKVTGIDVNEMVINTADDSTNEDSPDSADSADTPSESSAPAHVPSPSESSPNTSRRRNAMSRLLRRQQRARDRERRRQQQQQ